MALIGFILANDANDSGAAPAGKLRRSLADLAVQPHHQDGVLRGRHSGPAKAFDGGDKGYANPGRFIH